MAIRKFLSYHQDSLLVLCGQFSVFIDLVLGFHIYGFTQLRIENLCYVIKSVVKSALNMCRLNFLLISL